MSLQFSLRQWLAITIMTAALFGITFRMYDSGYAPDRREIMASRTDRLVHPWGSRQCYGFPFNTMDVLTSWSLEDPEESSASFQRRTTVFWPGIALNLAFWFCVSIVVCLLGGRLFGIAQNDALESDAPEPAKNE